MNGSLALLLGLGGGIGVYFILRLALAVEYTRGGVIRALFIAGGLWVLGVVTAAITAKKHLKAETPLNKRATPYYWAIAGACLGLSVAVALGYVRYVQPQQDTDLLIHSQQFIGSHISVIGKVRSGSVSKDESYALFELDGNNVLVRTDQLANIPREGDEVWTFGRASLARNGSVQVDEYHRWR
jgi:hypothetical protein